MIKTIIKHLIYGIAGGCILFVMWIIFMDLVGYEGLQNFFDHFTVNALSFIAIGAGFSMSSLVHEIKRLSLWLKIAINALVGFSIFFLVGHNTGLLSVESLINIVFYAAIAAVLFIAVWFGDYLINRRDAKKMNEKVKERKLKRNVDE